MAERVYTTLDIAKVCRVSLRTVIRWVDEGRLSSFRTPGGHRRVKEHDLAGFLTKYNMPFPIQKEQESRKILIMDEQNTMKKILQHLLRRASDECEIVLTENPYEAAIRIGFLQPHLVILAVTELTKDIGTLCKVLRKTPETKGIKVMVLNLSSNALSNKGLLSMGVHSVVVKPFSTNILREQVLRLLEYSGHHTS